VIVTAAGGGIQATAWTGRVITGLCERYSDDFVDSVGLVSSVSGGSVGAMYCLSAWDEFNGSGGDDRGQVNPKALQQVNEMCRASSLEATGWGLAYPDLMRMAFPALVSPGTDRGWAIEESWRGQLKKRGNGSENWRLSDLADRVRKGKAPVIVFNATLAETGQRLLISPVTARPTVLGKNPYDDVEFAALFADEGAELRVSTAARLSAGFPYVSPLCRAGRCDRTYDGIDDPKKRKDFEHREYLKDAHVVDGGYVDNEGAFTALDWIHLLVERYAGVDPADRPFQQVLIVRVQPFPPVPKDDPRGGRKGWVYEVVGPLTTLGHVRVASQAERSGSTKSRRHLKRAEIGSKRPSNKISPPLFARRSWTLK
jgi:hypothetical protein